MSRIAKHCQHKCHRKIHKLSNEIKTNNSDKKQVRYSSKSVIGLAVGISCPIYDEFYQNYLI